MRAVTTVLASLLVASCGSPDVADRSAEGTPNDSDQAASTAFDVCSKAVRSLAKNPSASQVPEGVVSTDGQGAFIVDWRMGSGLALQNAFGAMLDTTSTCLVENGLVSFLALDEKTVSFDELHKSAIDGESFAADGISDSGDNSRWEPAFDLDEALDKARLKAAFRRPVMFNPRTEQWSRRAYLIGPMSVSSRTSQLTSECDAEGRTVKFYIVSILGANYDSESAAYQERFTPSESWKFNVELGYCRTASGWIYHGGTYGDGILPNHLPILAKNIDYVPMSGLVPFISDIGGE